jgi:outer membrane protein OmpA-like peptidoglycan-associated protein
VLRALFRRHGISAERLEAVGHGASGPIAAGAPKTHWVVSFVIAQRARERAGAQK